MYVKTNRKVKRKILVCEDDLGLSCWKGGGQVSIVMTRSLLKEWIPHYLLPCYKTAG